MQGNEKFPDIKGLCDAIRGLGLKFGIYSTPWETSYAGYPGGSSENPEGSWTKPAGKTVKNNVRDLWRQKDLGQFTDEFSLPVAPHSGEMVKISG